MFGATDFPSQAPAGGKTRGKSAAGNSIACCGLKHLEKTEQPKYLGSGLILGFC
jgi:hypothetical protein